MRVILFS
jgi:cation-transporting ATPase 13A1